MAMEVIANANRPKNSTWRLQNLKGIWCIKLATLYCIYRKVVGKIQLPLEWEIDKYKDQKKTGKEEMHLHNSHWTSDNSIKSSIKMFWKGYIQTH